MKKIQQFAVLLILGITIPGGCYTADSPQELSYLAPPSRSVKAAAWDVHIEDLDDPAELAKIARVDLLIAPTWAFWQGSLDIQKIRDANPDIKILGYFRAMGIRQDWADSPEGSYTRRLYDAALPYLCYTTMDDTVSTWPGTYNYDITNPDARSAVFGVFKEFQETNSNKFDGIFFDYFSPALWVPSFIQGVEGDPDLDRDGIPHWDDPDELQAFLDGEDAYVDEIRAAMGEDFIQVTNGVRAHTDSLFASKFDGAFYEDFPNQGFFPPERFIKALDFDQPNNLFAARHWFRTQNGGPWMIISHKNSAGIYFDSNLEPVYIDGDNFTRVIAMLTDGVSTCFEGFGLHEAGIPEVEYNLGPPLGGVTVDGNIYSRDFQDGRVEVFMRTGDYPFPFDYVVYQNGEVLDQSDFPPFNP